MPTRVLIALGRQMCLEGLRHVLSTWEGVEVVAEAGDGRDAISLAAMHRPDVAVIETILPGLNGADVTRRIVAECPGVSVVALSNHADWDLVTRLMRAGASAYVLEEGGLADLRRAFDAIKEGNVFMSPAAEAAVLSSLDRESTDEAANILSAREREVLQLVAEGKSTKEVADTLNVSVKTIETHRLQVMKKLGIYTVAGLTKFALRARLTSLDD